MMKKMLPNCIIVIGILLHVTILCQGVLTKVKECTNYADGSMKKEPEEYVNILGGSNSRYDISHGSTLPLITRPWGFNSYAPQTDDDPTWPGWWFHPTDRRFFGLRVTRQPSPWIRDYGNFLIKAYMPTSPTDLTASQDGFTGFSPTKSNFSPYYFGTSLYSYGNSAGNMNFEFTPSRHGGIIQASFPTYIASEVGDDGNVNQQIRRISIVLSGATDTLSIGKSPIDGTTMMSGYTKVNSGGVGNSNSAFAHYFVATIYAGKEGKEITSVSTTSSYVKNNRIGWVNFDPQDSQNDLLTIRFATSLISLDQALENLKREVTDMTFEALKTDAKQEWNEVLNRIAIRKPAEGYTPCEMEELYTIFYTSLYRASIFPRQLTEINAENQVIHWSPYASTPETRVQSGAFSTDSGFWDAWNTIYPLLTLANRPMLSTTIQGWIHSYQEGGWLPKWASPGYRGSMIGTMGDVSLADAIVKEIPNIDIDKAYEAIRKDAFDIPPQGVDGVGRVCLESYLQYGYVPRGAIMTTGGTCYEVVSRTLNYLQSDWAIAQAAAKLGKTSDAQILTTRARNYTKLFDPETGFFRSKQIETEKWTVPFDQYAWGGDYTESGPWQYRFYVPYDVEGLANTYESSGRNYCDVLNTMHTTRSTFHIGNYNEEIHEQTELPDHCWGQYAHNNQPIHYLLYMHMIHGYTSECATSGHQWIRKTLIELYSADSNMFPGDEDNGEMAAWFVLSSIGLYERSPGSSTFEFGIPLFNEIEIDISDIPHRSQGSAVAHPAVKGIGAEMKKKTLRIVTKNNAKEHIHIHRILWNQEVIPSSMNSIEYSKLAQGGTLTFELGPVPK